MILPGHLIKEYNIIEPFVERTKYQGMTYGCGPAGYDIRLAQTVNFYNIYKFCIGSTIEKFKMPNNVLGIVHDKSTWARCGLSLFNTVIEPGWEGYLTVEMVYHGVEELEIEAGMPIAQVIFHTLVEPTRTVYSGKYQHQPNRPVPAIFETD